MDKKPMMRSDTNSRFPSSSVVCITWPASIALIQFLWLTMNDRRRSTFIEPFKPKEKAIIVPSRKRGSSALLFRTCLILWANISWLRILLQPVSKRRKEQAMLYSRLHLAASEQFLGKGIKTKKPRRWPRFRADFTTVDRAICTTLVTPGAGDGIKTLIIGQRAR